MYFSSCAANDFDAMRGVWFNKMDMDAFPLMRILGGNAHLEAERYCNALVIKRQSVTSVLWLQILQLYPLNFSA
jgi:hypothetical protein